MRADRGTWVTGGENGERVKRKEWGLKNGLRIAALNEEGATAYYLTDQVDSVSHVLDDTSRTLTRIQYRPYGEAFVQTGNLDFAAKYNSQELDKESNFYFYNARYYDPAIARFTSADRARGAKGLPPRE